MMSYLTPAGVVCRRPSLALSMQERAAGEEVPPPAAAVEVVDDPPVVVVPDPGESASTLTPLQTCPALLTAFSAFLR
jgi:hypothetical protein